MSDAADAFLASLGGDAGGGGGKKKKKRGKKKADPAPTADSASAPTAAAAAAPPPPSGDAAPAPAPAAAAPTPATDAADAFLASLGDPEPSGGGGGKKKRKKKKGKGGGGDGEASPAPAPTADGDATTAAATTTTESGGKKGKKGGKKQSAAAKRILEMKERQRLEDERRAKEEAEQRAKEEEEERKRKEEEERKEKLAEARREAKRKKKEDQKKAGTYKTKKQKAQEAAAAARLKQMQEAGLIVGVPNDGAGGAGGDSSSKKRGFVKRNNRKGKGGKKHSPVVEKEVPPVDDAPAAQQDETPEEELPAAAADAADASAGAAAGAGAGTEAPEEDPAESDDDDDDALDDWEALADDDDADIGPTIVKVTGKVDEEDAATAEALAASKASLKATKDGTADTGVTPPAGAGAGVGNAARNPDGSRMTLEDRIDASRDRRRAREAEAEKTLSPDRLRSPICCVLGHVDTGKTKLLDRIRRTNVQDGEAGGITQQIGATYFPMDRIRRNMDKLNQELRLEYKVPGLLMIDTPGHESFTNLRSRGSSLCDIAVLVVDLMHGLEPQTIESLNLLRRRHTPFIVALNKIDRVYGWKAVNNSPVRASLATQEDYAVTEFEDRTKGVLTQLAEQGLNAKLYYENDDFKRIVSVVPTSAMTGEGVPDLLMLLVQLTQQLMSKKLMFSPVVACTVLEVKAIEGLGTTIDVVLVNGQMKEGDTIVVCGLNGPIVTNVRALLTPQPMKEIRVKGDYVHHKTITAAMGIKIAAHNLEKAVAGTSLLVAHPEDEIEDLREEVMEDLEAVMGALAKETRGVFVQASTLGSLEALMEYLRSRDPPVPVANVAIGPIHKKEVVLASTMLEHRKEYATILAFDVKVTSDARAAAEELGVTIFTADIIYHLTDQFDEYLGAEKKRRQEASAAEAVFPAMLKIVPTGLFNKKSPLVLGVDVTAGTLRVGTPLAVVTVTSGGGGGGVEEGKGDDGDDDSAPSARVVSLGRVTSIERNHENVMAAKAGGPSVAIKVERDAGDAPVVYGRHFTLDQPLYSRITRASIDVLKRDFREDVTKQEWKLVQHLKTVFGIP